MYEDHSAGPSRRQCLRFDSVLGVCVGMQSSEESLDSLSRR
jgi:hypothetical protein